MNDISISRRRFVQHLSGVAALGALVGWHLPLQSDEPLFKLSLSHWSYHRAIFGDSRRDYNWFIKTLHSETDFTEAMRLILAGGFRGYVSVEYEGDGLTEDEGVAATKRLLEAVRETLTSEFG